MIGCLIVHGFVGAPDETAEIEHHLKDKNWLVYCPELPGHDGTKEGLKSVTYKHWLYKAEVAMKELLNRCDKVYVIGFSMGGVIASYLASKYPVERLVLISSAIYYLNIKQLMQDMRGWLIESIRGDLDDDDVYQFYKAKIQRLPMTATFEFAKMVKRLRPHVDEITAPTLVIQGKNDGLVPEKSAEYIYEHIQSKEKELFYFPEAKHYIWFGDEKDELLEMIDDFFHK
ncbi:alpha/beta fold hydrolase [Salipaludibacillus agaradhaerens]|uniref:alpha/beta hydrolase n=1 Tax=Salipaludibacillus agaradhaerens TaxID=76935 RepID=UPI0021514B66|nr:alpha/beta fold hydrolase [Salipaludibacillus agaradhaerens]MCR6107926.1 alpha/beta fold hydrolase [Salipaludibacillus agaradhaerens]MCR6119952.1 alpha/beta fold hydrolase [Salipaludibacillus agaradhaerens]UJW59004.1 alpha/beta fold hydrolase [Bacillus sp. A116_S68]